MMIKPSTQIALVFGGLVSSVFLYFGWYNSSDKITTIHRTKVMCCGYGDRIKIIESAYRKYENEPIAIDMGTCNGKSVWGTLFDKMDSVHISSCEEKHSIKSNQKIYSVENPTDLKRDKCVGRMNRKNHNKKNPYEYLTTDSMRHVVETMYHSVSDHIRGPVNRFKNKHFKKYMVGVHIRYGNPNEKTGKNSDRDFARKMRNKFILNDDIDTYVQKQLQMIDQMVLAMGKGINSYGIYIASDTKRVIDIAKKYSNKIISRPDTYFPESGHPLTYNKLRHNNGGSTTCNMTWFEDPLKDLLLLSETDIFISSSPSGFTLFPAVHMLNNGKPYCQMSSSSSSDCWDHRGSYTQVNDICSLVTESREIFKRSEDVFQLEKQMDEMVFHKSRRVLLSNDCYDTLTKNINDIKKRMEELYDININTNRGMMVNNSVPNPTRPCKKTTFDDQGKIYCENHTRPPITGFDINHSVTFIGDSITKRFFNTYVQRRNSDGTQIHKGSRCNTGQLLFPRQDFIYNISKRVDAGPIAYGLDHPGCMDCSSCGAQKIKFGDSYLEYIGMEFAKDYTTGNGTFTSQDMITRYLSKNEPDVIYYSVGTHDWLLLTNKTRPRDWFKNKKYNGGNFNTNIFKENIQSWVNSLKTNIKRSKICVGLVPFTGFSEANALLPKLNQIHKDILIRNNITCIVDMMELSRPWSIDVSNPMVKNAIPDGLHPQNDFFHVIINSKYF